MAFNSLVVVGTHATFSGTATHNGVTTTFTINVDDLASPGKGRYCFAISTGDGYSRSDVLSSGYIQVPQPVAANGGPTGLDRSGAGYASAAVSRALY